MSRARSKIAKDILRQMNYLEDLPPELSEEQRNQQACIRYYIRMFAYEDKLEVVNTLTEDENMALLNQCFGVFDSAVVPCTGFDGCVIQTKMLREE